MANVKMPDKINGSWIWKRSLLNSPDTYMLMRKEFVCNSIGMEANFWISANSAYQLFINGRFVGFGPHAHSHRGSGYVDNYKVTYYLEAGINVIAILLYYNGSFGSSDRRNPGLWCQLDTGHQQIVSDETWFIHEGVYFGGHRARLAPERGMSFIFRAKDCPQKWNKPMFLPDASWYKPDYVVRADGNGTKLELYPLPPPIVNDEHCQVIPIERGRVSDCPNWTQVVFNSNSDTTERTYAAESYIFSREDCEIPVKLFTDDPFKFFCNNRLVALGKHWNGEESVLAVHAGWNRLLLIMEPVRHSMGFFMIMPESISGQPFKVLMEMSEEAQSGWNIAGPLKLSLEAATPSLGFGRLLVRHYRVNAWALTDPFDFLNHSVFSPSEQTPGAQSIMAPLSEREYVVCRLDKLRYGFACVHLEASEGDIVDVTVGLSRTERRVVIPAGGTRGTGSVICRRGANMFLSFLPSDCFYIMISVRKAASTVSITEVQLEELYRPARYEAQFRSSDELLNRFWDIGKQTLRRSAAFVPLAEPVADFDCYMLDAYIDAVNMAAVFGDYDYTAVRLRQFLDSQLENGDIPALTFGRKSVSQIHHLFFLPVWIHYNCRFGGKRKELEYALTGLDLAREYFEAMIDEETGLLVDVESRFGLHSRLSHGDFREDEIPTYLNALFCRFLLSASEIYHTAGQEETAAHCMELARNVAEQLRKLNFEETIQLFGRWNFDAARKPDYNLFANFCAMFGGVYPMESFFFFFEAFFSPEPPFDKSKESEHPYFHFLFVEMMFAIAERDWAFDYFRSYWSRRISEECGAWRLSHDDVLPAPTRFSDGSCVTPNVFLLREVAGVRFAESGHQVVYFNPAFNLVEWVDSVLPLAAGKLKVQWKRMEDSVLSVTLDSTVPVKIVPEMSAEQLRNTEFQLGEKVTLLNPRKA